MTFNVGTAVKYLWRHGEKDPAATIEDLKKARWYIDQEISRLTGPTQETSLEKHLGAAAERGKKDPAASNGVN
jgi:hypothetical protein